MMHTSTAIQRIRPSVKKYAGITLVGLSALCASWSYALTIADTPLGIQAPAKNMVLLNLSKEHRLFKEAYPDYIDIDGDGTLDYRFKPFINYLGLFDPNFCYSHNGASDNSGLFTPVSVGTTASFTEGPKTYSIKTCPGKWSGNFLNYVTTTRIDALRVVLYGGLRDVDTTTDTVLRRAYIPQDAHSWAKEYTSEVVDKYKISDYTPLSQPNAASGGKTYRHYFGSFTNNIYVNCSGSKANLDNCSNTLAPRLTVVTNGTKRVWEWASSERPVLHNTDNNAAGYSTTGGGVRTNYSVRVQVCTAAFRDPDNCKLYPNGNYKPVGLLHEYGETDLLKFGLFTGSYDKNTSGGRLRKVIDSFRPEVLASTTGQFSTATGIVSNINNLRITDFNSDTYIGGWVTSRPMDEGEFPDWGNPVGEMMYEAARYLANKGSPTAAFSAVTTKDNIVGMSTPSWDVPYAEGTKTSTASAPKCSRAYMMTISDTNISFDSNQLPGASTDFTSTSMSTDLTGRHIKDKTSSTFNVSIIMDYIGGNQPEVTGSKFIGQAGTNYDGAPSAKSITSGKLSNLRGLSPEEPTLQGSYSAAGVANFTRVNDLNPNLDGNQVIRHILVGLASPFPAIKAKTKSGKIINFTPLSKDGGGNRNIGSFQGTNQLVDIYIEKMANTTVADQDLSVNGGLYYALFRINYEDVEQGADHDMDAIMNYEIKARSDDTIEVNTQISYQAGGLIHRAGYTVFGSTKDGIYLTNQDENDQDKPFYLSVPPGREPGYCNLGPGKINVADYNTANKKDCLRLPYLGGAGTQTVATFSASNAATAQFIFTPSASTTDPYLNHPFWYAAKWGGFNEDTGIGNNNAKPDDPDEWDADGDGVPDAFLQVQNPTKLKEQLTKAFKAALTTEASSSNLAANVSGKIQAGSYVYRATFLSSVWSGDIEAYPLSSTGVDDMPAWKVRSRMPAWDQRNLFMNTSAGGALKDLKSTGFTSLPAPEQTALSTSGIYNYIKGDRSNEIGWSSTGVYRKRGDSTAGTGVLGDIIYSTPIFDVDSDTLYIGANDGMLHAFSGTMGYEKFGVIPRASISKLSAMSSTSYNNSHTYFVDGDVGLGFKMTETNNTKNIYSLLGRGGKGLFSIQPNASALITSTTAPALLWEYTPAHTQTVVTIVGGGTTTAAQDKDLGLMLSRPVFAKLKNNKVGILAGNGYNSDNGKAVLYVFILNKDGSLDSIRKIDAGAAGDNGLAGPAFDSSNADLQAEAVYAGDLKGNVWKFDVSDPDPSKWKVALSGQPLFKAVDAAGNTQPITAPMTARFNNAGSDPNNGKVFLFFGTGSWFQASDNTNTTTQSWYGIIDDQSTSITDRSKLVQRSITSYATVTTPSGIDTSVRYSSTATTADMTGKRGWYMDFSNPGGTGERIFTRSVYVDNTKEPTLQVTSIYPIVSADICIAGGGSWLNMVSPFTGSALDIEIFDGYGKASSVGLDIGIATTPQFFGTTGGSTNIEKEEKKRYCEGNSCRDNTPPRDCFGKLVSVINGSLGMTSGGQAGCNSAGIRGRVSWREILKD